MDLSKSAEKAASWVPQVFFDFIARVAPGTVLWLVVVISIVGPSDLSELDQVLAKFKGASAIAVATMIPLFLVLSYALSICLWGICYLGFLALRPFSKVLQGQDPENRKSVEAYRHEAIRHYDPVAGTRLTKIKAEVQFSSVLVIGLGLAVIHGFAMAQIDPNQGAWIKLSLFFLAGALGSGGALIHFRRRARQVSDECVRFLAIHRNVDIMEPLPVKVQLLGENLATTTVGKPPAEGGG